MHLQCTPLQCTTLNSTALRCIATHHAFHPYRTRLGACAHTDVKLLGFEGTGNPWFLGVVQKGDRDAHSLPICDSFFCFLSALFNIASTALHCTALHLHPKALELHALQCTALHCTTRHSTSWHCTALYCT